jgi:signal transduction histidine kinase/CheY-like chemotaxis protein
VDESNDPVLILAPLGRDAEVLAAALRNAGLHPELGRSVDEVAARVATAGVLLLAEEALARADISRLLTALDRQLPWSDVPIVILTSGGRMAEPSAAALQRFHRLGNVTLLERPLRIMTLVSTVASALRARRRQYEVRDHLMERVRNEAELKLRADEATAASRAKDEFLAMLGHELRNPLGALTAASNLLDVTAATDSDASAPARRVIGRQLRHLTRLVDDLLDVSRVTSGKIELSRRPLDVALAVSNCVAALRAAGRIDGHTLEVATAPAWVHADEVRFDQIVNNLLVNALKYTRPGGRIDVAVECDDGTVSIHVRDNGIGMGADLVPRVFDLFVQGGSALERTQGGLGIGLTLVRRLVDLHGGAVEAHSDGPGQGSTFVVRLPGWSVPPEAEAPAVREPVASPRRVLVIEDHEDAREMMALMLKDAGHQVYQASDGAEGLAVALRERPDVAIVDIGLPGLSGYEIAVRLRATPEGTHMLLVALSGYGLAEDRRRSTEAGFDHHLVKPVDFGQLTRVLSRAA